MLLRRSSEHFKFLMLRSANSASESELQINYITDKVQQTALRMPFVYIARDASKDFAYSNVFEMDIHCMT